MIGALVKWCINNFRALKQFCQVDELGKYSILKTHLLGAQ